MTVLQRPEARDDGRARNFVLVTRPHLDVETWCRFRPTQYEIDRLRQHSGAIYAALLCHYGENNAGMTPEIVMLVDRRDPAPPMSADEQREHILEWFWSRHGGSWSPVVRLVSVEAATARHRNHDTRGIESEAP